MHLRNVLIALLALLSPSFDAGYRLNPGPLAGGKAGREAGTPAASAVARRAVRQQAVGAKLETVGRWTLCRTLRLPGRVAVEEARLHRLQAVTQGWIREVGPATTGSLVRKGQVLATYCAPGIATLVHDFIGTVETYQKLKETRSSGQDAVRRRAELAVYERSIVTTQHTLMDLGMPVEQIDRVRTTLEFAWLVEIRSPVSGLVVARNVSSGQRFERSRELYTIADLSRVWILADAFEDDAEHVRPGTRASVTHPDLGEAAIAQVSSVLPRSGPAIRTLKVRLEADNPGFVLRPDMIVNVELPVELEPALGPNEAVILGADLPGRVSQGFGGSSSGRTTRPASVPSGSSTTARSS